MQPDTFFRPERMKLHDKLVKYRVRFMDNVNNAPMELYFVDTQMVAVDEECRKSSKTEIQKLEEEAETRFENMQQEQRPEQAISPEDYVKQLENLVREVNLRKEQSQQG